MITRKLLRREEIEAVRFDVDSLNEVIQWGKGSLVVCVGGTLGIRGSDGKLKPQRVHAGDWIVRVELYPGVTDFSVQDRVSLECLYKDAP